MSRVFESMIRRGAGLGPAPGAPVLAPRPLSRFERAAPELGAGGNEGPVPVSAPPPTAADAVAPVAPPVVTSPLPPSGRQSAAQPDDASVPLAHHPPTDGAGEPMRPAAIPGRDAPTSVPASPIVTVERTMTTGVRAPAPAATAGRPEAAIDTVATAASSRREGPDVPAGIPAPVQAAHRIDTPHATSPILDSPTSLAPPASPRTADKAPDTPKSAVAAAVSPPRQRPERAPALPMRSAPLAEPRHVEATPPPLSISIGRIEIDFAPPPAPAAAPATPRTRGFANLAGARRGILR
jgi:hypothetical protein